MSRSLAALVLAALVQAPAASAAGWSWPVDGPVLRPFVFGNDPYAAGQHRGIDIGAAPGTTVRAATTGSVSFAGTVPAGGRAVTVRTTDGLSVTYLELGATRVERGAEVAEGDTIGTIGAASHVHLGVRVTADPQGYLDPLQFLPPRVPGPAQADVPEPPVDVVPREPVAEAVDRAQAPTAQAAVKTKPEPEPVVPVPSAPAAAPSTAPVATEPAPAPVIAEPAPEAKASESVEPASERTAAAADQVELSPARELTAPDGTRDGPAPHRGRRQSSVGSPKSSRGAPSPRSRRRIAKPPLRVTRVKPKPVITVPAPESTEIESHHGSGRAAGQSDAERSIAPVLLVALLVLGLMGGAAATLRRRRRSSSIPPHSAGRCSIGPVRPPRSLHACVRAGEVGWLATATRSRSLIAMHRPLPRPRRRVPNCPSRQYRPSLLARDHAAPEPTLALTKAHEPWLRPSAASGLVLATQKRGSIT